MNNYSQVDTDVIIRLLTGNAMLVALAERTVSHVIYSYDHDFDQIPTVTRTEP